MSYLNDVRFSFAGTFQAAVSTINNTSTNYNKDTTEETNPAWNPDGNAFWRFLDCTVQSAHTGSGPASGDPILQSSFDSVDQPAPGKLVDLDPQQQSVSQVWGMSLQLGTSGGENSFAGNFEPVAFCDMWSRREDPQGSPWLSAFYQSVLTDVSWGNLTSPVLRALEGLSSDTLSIKFNVDLYNWFNGTTQQAPPGFPSEPGFTYGRVVGTVGPYLPNEPAHFVSGRLLRSRESSTPGFYFAPCAVSQTLDKVFVDLGNSVPTLWSGEVDPDQGNLRLAVLNPTSRLDRVAGAVAAKSGVLPGPTQYIFPQPLDYADYTTNAGVQAVDLDSALISTVLFNPLAIVEVDSGGNYLRTRLQEGKDGWFVRADQFVFRMNPTDASGSNPNHATARLQVTKFGAPQSDVTINLDKSAIGTGDPALEALTIPTSVTTGADGWAEVQIQAANPGYPRPTLEIDGQVYAIEFALDVPNPTDAAYVDPWLFISVQIYTDWAQQANDFDAPTWDGDVQSVLNQYGVLYPFMKNPIGIDLGNYQSVVDNIDNILAFMNFAQSDPRHMPVTRDMSRSRLQLIENWRANGLPES